MTEAEWLASTDPVVMLRYLQNPSDNANTNHLYPPSDRKLRLFAVAACRHPAVWERLTDPRSRHAVEVAERYADGDATRGELVLALSGASHAYEDSESFEAELAARCAARIDALTENAGLPRWFSVSTKLAAAQADLLRCIFGNPYRPVVGLPRDVGQVVERMGNKSLPQHQQRDVILEDWLTPTVRSLATRIYAERDWSALPVLADALEEAGCPAWVECQECVDGDVGCSRCEGAGIIYDPPYSLAGRKKCPANCNDGLLWDKCARCDGRGTVPHPLLAHLRGPGPHARGCWALDLLLGKS